MTEERLAALAARQGGAFTRAQALTCGFNDGELAHRVRTGRHVRLRRGVYAERERLAGLDDAARHVLRTHAVMLSLRGAVVVSHVSAVALHRLPLWRADLREVHVTRLDDGAARSEAGVRHHVGLVLGPDDVVTVDGLPAVTLARALIEMASVNRTDTGVVAMDAALHLGLVTREDLDETFDRMRTWPRARQANRAVTFADGRSESVGESRLRLLLDEHGLPAPELQQEIRAKPGGRLVGRVDFLFIASGLVVEFDGKVKYGGDGPGAAEVVVAEKRREDEIRELGHPVLRVVWDELDSPRTAERVERGTRHERRPVSVVTQGFPRPADRGNPWATN